MKLTMISLLLGTAMLAVPAVTSAQSTTPATTGSYSSVNVGVGPVHGLDAPAFSAAASDADVPAIGGVGKVIEDALRAAGLMR